MQKAGKIEREGWVYGILLTFAIEIKGGKCWDRENFRAVMVGISHRNFPRHIFIEIE